MGLHEREELVAMNTARKGFYEFLASVYKVELTEEQIESLAKCDLPADDEFVGAGYGLIRSNAKNLTRS